MTRYIFNSLCLSRWLFYFCIPLILSCSSSHFSPEQWTGVQLKCQDHILSKGSNVIHWGGSGRWKIHSSGMSGTKMVSWNIWVLSWWLPNMNISKNQWQISHPWRRDKWIIVSVGKPSRHSNILFTFREILVGLFVYSCEFTLRNAALFSTP